MTQKHVRMNPREREAQLLRSAYNLAKRQGYRTLTREAVAKEAGVTPGLLTRYFSSMNDVHRHIIDEAIENKNVYLILEGVISGDKKARRAVKKLRDEIDWFLYH